MQEELLHTMDEKKYLTHENIRLAQEVQGTGLEENENDPMEWRIKYDTLLQENRSLQEKLKSKPRHSSLSSIASSEPNSLSSDEEIQIRYELILQENEQLKKKMREKDNTYAFAEKNFEVNYTELQEENAYLQRIRQDLQDKLSCQTDKVLDLSARCEHHETLVVEKNALDEKLMNYKNLFTQEQQELQAKIAEQKVELESLQLAKGNLEQELVSEREELRRSLSEARAVGLEQEGEKQAVDISASEDQAVELKDQLLQEQKEKDLLQGQLQELTEKEELMVDWKEKCSVQEEEISALNDKLQESLKEKELIVDLKEKLSSEQEEYSVFSENLQEAAREKELIVDLKGKSNSAEDESEELQVALKEKEELLVILRGKLSSEQDEKNSLSEKLQEALKEKEELIAVWEEKLSSEQEEKNSLNQNLHEALKQKEELIVDLKEKLSSEKDANSGLSANLQDTLKVKEELLVEAESQKDVLKEELQKVLSEFEEMKEEHDGRTQEIILQLQTEAKDLQDQFNLLLQENELLTNSNKETNSQLTEDLEKLREEKVLHEEKAAQLQEEIKKKDQLQAELNEECERLKAEFETAIETQNKTLLELSEAQQGLSQFQDEHRQEVSHIGNVEDFVEQIPGSPTSQATSTPKKSFSGDSMEVELSFEQYLSAVQEQGDVGRDTSIATALEQVKKELQDTIEFYSRENGNLTEALEAERAEKQLLVQEQRVIANTSQQDSSELLLQLKTLQEKMKLAEENSASLQHENTEMAEKLRKQEEFNRELSQTISTSYSVSSEVQEVFGRQLSELQTERNELVKSLAAHRENDKKLSEVLGEKEVLEETLRREKQLLAQKLHEKELIEIELLQEKSALEKIGCEQQRLEERLQEKDEHEQKLMKQKRHLEEKLSEIETHLQDRESVIAKDKSELRAELNERDLAIKTWEMLMRERIEEEKKLRSNFSQEVATIEEGKIREIENRRIEMDLHHADAIQRLRQELDHQRRKEVSPSKAKLKKRVHWALY